MKQLERVFTEYGVRLDAFDAEQTLIDFKKYVMKSLRLRGMKDYTPYEKEDFSDEFLLELFKKNNAALEVIEAEKIINKVYKEKQTEFQLKEFVQYYKIILDTNDYRPHFYSYRKSSLEVVDELKKDGKWSEVERWLREGLDEKDKLSILFDLKLKDTIYTEEIRRVFDKLNRDMERNKFYENLKRDLADGIQEWIEEQKKA